jgi:hypothetical protein
MATLTVRHLIPFGTEPWGERFVNFYQWAPADESEALVRKTPGYEARLWFDRSCIDAMAPADDDDISRWVNVRVGKVYVDVLIDGVPDELALFIRNERDSPRIVHHGITPEQEEYPQLHETYRELGIKVSEFALTTYNRFVAFARNHKGQYWLVERPFDRGLISSRNNEFNAKVRTEYYDWVRWCPSHPHMAVLYIDGDELSIRRDEWSTVQDFISSNSRPSLVFELLANAWMLIDEGYRRSAIMDAVAALEQAVITFSQSPRLDGLIPVDILPRVDVSNLKNQVDHLGFSATVRYLLPLLFPAQILSTELLARCQEAVDIRNNIAHVGQRDVREEKVRPLVAALRHVCEILAQYRE